MCSQGHRAFSLQFQETLDRGQRFLARALVVSIADNSWFRFYGLWS